MGTTIPSFLQWVLHHACAWAGQTDFYIKAELRARGSSWKLAGGEAGWEGKLGEEAEEELSEGGGGREGRKRGGGGGELS